MMQTIEIPRALEKVVRRTAEGSISVIWGCSDHLITILYKGRGGGVVAVAGGSADSLSDALELVEQVLSG